MSYFDDASLVMIPSGYKTSKVYSVKPTDGSGDLTFSRSNDTATRVNSAGLIEKVRTNLITYSQDFSNADWSKTGCTVTADYATAPDGTNTADRLVFGASGNEIVQTLTGLTVGAEYSVSFYAKTESGTFNFQFGNMAYIVVSGTATNEWQRFTVTQQASATTRFPKITASGSGTLILWGFQVETGVTTDYIATTTAAVSVGPVANVPRLDYLGSTCGKLILEPQRTNVVTYSEQLNNAAWIPNSGGTGVVPVVTANNATAPDGTMSADTVVFNAGAGTTASDQSGIYQNLVSLPGGTYTGSFYAKTASGTAQIMVRHAGGGSYTKFTITDQWQRFTSTEVNVATATQYFEITIRRGLNEPINSSATIQLWGVQLELGAYATSYIPTLGAAVTRGADACYKTGVSSLIGQTEGVLFAEINVTNPTANFGIALQQTKDDYQSSMYLFNVGSGSNFVVDIFNGGTQQSGYVKGSTLSAGINKIAIAYKANDFAVALNGTVVHTDNSGSVPTCGVLNYTDSGIGTTYRYAVAQTLLFKTRLTNAQLAELTTI